MQYLPQFSQNQDQMPQDDAMMQLELQRRMKFADALRNQAAPEGQMVSGHYVAPSWTQHLAGLANKYVAGQQEQGAMKQYGDYQKSKSAKLGTLLDELNKGKQVESPVDYQDAGGMPGITQTTQQPFNQQEYMAKIGAVMPEMLPKMLETNFAQRFKEKQGHVMTPGSTYYEDGKAVYTAPNKEESRYAKINPLEATPESLAEYERTGNPTVLRKTPAAQTPRNVQFEKVREGNKEVTYQVNSDGTRTKIATGSAFAPEKPQPDPWHFNDKPSAPLTNSKGWTLHTDKSGNKAYVSPDGKQFEEAR